VRKQENYSVVIAQAELSRLYYFNDNSQPFTSVGSLLFRRSPYRSLPQMSSRWHSYFLFGRFHFQDSSRETSVV